jgi:ribonuclease III
MQKSFESILDANIKSIEETIDYCFKDKKNIFLALTHSSFANENKNERLSSNERLEFLGDAVLNIIISEYIYNRFLDLTEGEMTKARAGIVCEASLMKCANGISLGKYLLLGKGEEITGGRTRTSILSDAFEALIGSIYLDGGLSEARDFIYTAMQEIIASSISGETFIDYKTQLQEFVQKSSDQKIQYEILEEKGPDHNKMFVSQVKVAERILGTGEGKTKKEAEQNAAKIALVKIREIEHA